MDKNDLYNKKFTKDNVTYSIDMLRLKTYITFNDFSKVEFLLKTTYKDKVKKFWLSDRPMCFHYNYSIEVEEGKSIYIAFAHNSEKIKFDKVNDLYNFTVEFNPNKLKDNSLLMYFLNLSGEWYIKSYDMAFDIPVSILDLIWDMSGRKCEKCYSNGYDDKTIYLGTGDGRIKIYNKKKQSKIEGFGDLTRIEISREMDDFEIRKVKVLKYDNNFPSIHINNYIYSLSDYKNKTMLAILYAVQNGFPLRDLTRDYRKKIKTMLSGGHRVRFCNKTATDVLRQTIFFYFINNSKVVWW